MAKDKRDSHTDDWVDEDEERRFKEERAMVRRRLKQEKDDARRNREAPEGDRKKPRP